MKKKQRKKRSGSKKKKIFKKLSFVLASGLLLIIGGCLGFIWYCSWGLPDIKELKENYRPYQTTRIFARDGSLIGEIFVERRIVVPLSRVPDQVKNAILAAEDADFYRHKGLDWPGIIRALITNIRKGKFVQGGSTITQQVVRNLLLSRERSLTRKMKEVLLARALESELTKDEILYLYLNHINFGHGRYGIEEAARFYFGRHVWQLSLSQAALIAGLPQAPAKLSPFKNPKAAKRRRRYVLDKMLENKFISPESYIKAVKAPLPKQRFKEPNLGISPEYVDKVREILLDRLGEDDLMHGGFRVYTPASIPLLKIAQNAIRSGLETIDRRHGYCGPYKRRRFRLKKVSKNERLALGKIYQAKVVGFNDRERTIIVDLLGRKGVIYLDKESRYNPRGLLPSRFVSLGVVLRVSLVRMSKEPLHLRLEMGPQAALISMIPKTRQVLAMVGGYNFNFGDFNRALKARRQPGSAFKPIVYSAAINTREFTAATVIYDSPEVFKRWRPQNHERWNFKGPVRLREALAQSINLVAVKVIKEVGPKEVVEYAKRLGIRSRLEADLALALGASSVTPIELTNAYAVFASGGIYKEPIFINKIKDMKGRVIDWPRMPPRRVLEEEEAFIITSMLQSVIQRGTGMRALRLKHVAAGKTGTSNKAWDAWFIGYTPQIITGVWVGFDDKKSLGKKECGSRAALPIWLKFMQGALKGKKSTPFKIPKKISVAEIDPNSGLLAYENAEEVIREYFLQGTVPSKTALPPDIIDPDTFIMQQTEKE